MYSIPASNVRYSSQTRSFCRGLSASIMANVRHGCAQSLSANVKHYENFTDSAQADIAQAVIGLADSIEAKAVFAVERQAVNDAIRALDGEPVSDTSHQLVRACSDLRMESELVRQTSEDYSAVDLSDTRQKLCELQDALTVEAETVANRFPKAKLAAQKAFGAALARCENVGQAQAVCEEHDTSIAKMLPQHWQIQIPVCLVGKATFSPASPIGSPERTASVIVQQCRNAIAADRQALDNKHKTSRRIDMDATDREIAALIKEAK